MRALIIIALIVAAGCGEAGLVSTNIAPLITQLYSDVNNALASVNAAMTDQQGGQRRHR